MHMVMVIIAGLLLAVFCVPVAIALTVSWQITKG